MENGNASAFPDPAWDLCLTLLLPGWLCLPARGGDLPGRRPERDAGPDLASVGQPLIRPVPAPAVTVDFTVLAASRV